MTLQTPVQIFQHEEEFEELLCLYREKRPPRVLEIGTYHGGTLYHWLRCAAPGATVVSVDSYAVGVDNSALYDDWCDGDVRLVVVRGDSADPDTVAKVASYGPYEWVFIDAGHLEDEVRADWENYRPLATGVVAFHDILPPTREHPEIQVAPLWQEIRETHDTVEIIADPNAPWGGIGVCYTRARNGVVPL